MMIRKLLALLVLSLLAAASASARDANYGDLIIRHVIIVDVERARTIRDQAVVIRGGDIVAVGLDARIAKRWRAGRSLDARGKYLIPGLWDMHVHFGGGPALLDENKALLPLYVANGVTAIRDASGDLPNQVLSWREQIARGRMFGPTLYTSGPKIEGLKPVWNGTIEVGDRADVDAALKRLQALRVDFVKITDNTLKPELFLYAVSQAKRLGMRTSGHIPMALTVQQAADAGLSSIEHLDYVYYAGARNQAQVSAAFAAGKITRDVATDRLVAAFDPATAMAAYRHFAALGLSVTPTLNGSRIIAWLDRDNHADDPYLAYVGPGLKATYAWRVERAAKADAAAIEVRHREFQQVASILPLLHKAGVPIMAGTDAGFLNSFNYPGFGLHDELALFVEQGLTPAQALASATRTGPAWFGKLARYGAIAPGKAADLVILTRNPLLDIRATRAIDAVVLRGAFFDRAALDGMLEHAKARVAQLERGAK